jgi:uncharacterized protein with ParB-like and HNH nuclease domain/predicted transport protein
VKATEAKLLAFLQKSPQFIIPIYQRTYSWTEKQCRQLWDDIIRAGSSEDVTAHFVGSIVYVQQGQGIMHWSPLLVIDGQQRLTTVSLLVEALARAVGDGEPSDGFSAAKLREYYLINRLEKGDRFFKLLLSQTDNASLMAIIKHTEQPSTPSLRVTENFQLFADLLAEQKHDLATVCLGLAKLVVVDIVLEGDRDNPQLIFESMNSTGKDLSQADLIRNYVLMGLKPDLQTQLYEMFWRPMELDFGQEAYSTLFDSFMRHYLTVRTGEIPREREVYEAFKQYSRTGPVQAAGITALVKDIRVFARFYCAMALDRENDATLAAAFRDLRDLRVDVAYPFLLEVYHAYDDKRLSADDFAAVLRLVEAYAFRRAVCAIPANSMNKTFSTFNKALKPDRMLESIEAHFCSLPSYRRFPSDDEFHRDLQTRDLYNFPRRSYWLRRIENHMHKEPVNVAEYTIEHILPQNPALSLEWQNELGADWQRVRQLWLHTLGNLTLTGYNAELSDRPFAEKRDMQGGFKQSSLRLNAGLGGVTVWNEAAIKARAGRLADMALTVWAGPQRNVVPPPLEPAPSPFGIVDHPTLLSDALRPVFESFRKQVLALDSNVSEVFLKSYVAYKADSNFVDIVPQVNRLRILLNMPFTAINDPEKRCRDVSQLGHLGNGDVDVFLASLDDLPYVMGLVRQSYEHQMGDAFSL